MNRNVFCKMVLTLVLVTVLSLTSMATVILAEGADAPVSNDVCLVKELTMDQSVSIPEGGFKFTFTI